MTHNNLVIFDVDGTLTQTVDLDTEAYFEAFSRYFPDVEIDTDWRNYRFSTDSGLAIELFEKHANQKPSEEILVNIQDTFIALMQNKLELDSERCGAIPGAEKLSNQIAELPHWDCAIATGCWKQSALVKLKHIHFPNAGIPLATGSNHIERYEIIKIAISRARQQYNRVNYNRIVYVGDQLWDYHAAQKLGIEFIGIGNTIKKENIAVPMVKDYTEKNFLMILDCMPACAHFT